MTSTQAPPEAVAPWRERRFLIFATGNFVNNLGESAYKVGLPLYVYELTGSLRTMSFMAALAPAILLISPWFGAIVDRWGSRVFVVPGLLVQLAGAVALNLSVLGHHVALPVLFGFATVVQVGGEMYRSGWIAGVRGMFPHNAARSRAALSTLFVISNVVGPVIVAVGVGAVGYLGLLWFNAASFLAPIAVWLAGVHPPAKDRSAPRHKTTLGRDLIDGWHIIRAEKRVMYVQVTALPLQFVSGVGVLAFMVWYLRDHWDVSASAVSVAQAAANVGALAGSAYIAARVSTRPRSVLAVSVAVMTAALFAMTIASPWSFVVCMVAFFTMRSAMTAVSAMIIVKYLPTEVLGRAEGLFNLLSGIPLLIAPLLIPAVQGAFGSTAVLLALGVTAGLALVCLARFWPRWDDSDPVDTPSPSSSDVPVT